jgi:hypothetical protein
MKTNYCVLILSLLVLSCHKEPTSVDNAQAITLTGKWQWIRSSGGIGGQTIIPPAGTVVIQTYSSDGVFSQSRNDTLQTTSHYSIKKQKTIYSTDSLDVIVYQDSTLTKQVILYLSVDTLSVGDNMYDGYGSIYKKIIQ